MMKFALKHNPQPVSVDMPDADKTLQNILKSCNMAPNTLPVEELVSRARENTSKYLLCMFISIGMLIATFFLPLVFKPAAMSASSQQLDITVDSSKMDGGDFVLNISGFMIDYTSIYAMNEEGTRIYPVSYDVSTGRVVFRYDGESWNIFIPDLNGNQLHLLLTPDK
jgi:hypothetical protein